jgi:nicotinamidase-related amidase
LSPCLIIVDVQNDYVLPSGALPCPGAEAIVPLIHDAAHSSFFSAGVYLSADDKEMAAEDAAQPAPRWPPHCISGSFGAQIHQALRHQLLPAAVVVTKRESMSAFGSEAKGETTTLRAFLQMRPPSHAVVCGLALE